VLLKFCVFCGAGAPLPDVPAEAVDLVEWRPCPSVQHINVCTNCRQRIGGRDPLAMREALEFARKLVYQAGYDGLTMPSYEEMAEQMSSHGLTTATGKPWSAQLVYRLFADNHDDRRTHLDRGALEAHTKRLEEDLGEGHEWRKMPVAGPRGRKRPGGGRVVSEAQPFPMPVSSVPVPDDDVPPDTDDPEVIRAWQSRGLTLQDRPSDLQGTDLIEE
jgi:hypothetical protein